MFYSSLLPNNQQQKTKGKFRIDHEITCVLPSSAGPLPSNSPPSSPRDVLALEGEGANTGEEDIYIAEVSFLFFFLFFSFLFFSFLKFIPPFRYQ